MSSSSSSIIPTHTQIFSSPRDLLGSSATLCRITKLSALLPNPHDPGRKEILSELEAIWNDARENLATAQERIGKGFAALTSAIYKLYKPEIEASGGKEELVVRLRRFSEDANSVILPPAVNSSEGKMGPTHLVRYSRGEGTGVEKCIVKWTDRHEIVCNRIYEAIWRGFTSTPLNFNVYVPEGGHVDFDREFFENPKWERFKLEQDMATELKSNFFEMAKTIDPRRLPTDNQLLIGERVKGENLLDFIVTQYVSPDFDEVKKKKLFERLGRLFYMDIRLGYVDRAKTIDYDTDSGNYELMPTSANLGNVLFRWKDTSLPPILFAIDNGIDPALISSPEQRAKYLSFLRFLFKQHPDGLDLEEMLASNIILSLEGAFADIADRSKINDQIKVFEKDLQKIAKAEIVKGLRRMKEVFRLTIYPAWQNDQALKKYLRNYAPEYLQTLDAFINLEDHLIRDEKLKEIHK